MTPWLQDPDVTLYHGDCLDVLRELPPRSVHMCATSPPFYGLRDYGTGEWEGGNPDCGHIPNQRAQGGTRQGNEQGTPPNARDRSYAYGPSCGKCGARRVDHQIGLEETPDQWVQRLVAVFREVRRVLRDDGTLWVEIGDSYTSIGRSPRKESPGVGATQAMPRVERKVVWAPRDPGDPDAHFRWTLPGGEKPKDLLGQPWLLAFALRADGWYLRSEIIWARPNPMPESVTDRPTKSHSTVFLLSKQPRYFYDSDAIREVAKRAGESPGGNRQGVNEFGVNGGWAHGEVPAAANARSVWQIPTEPTPYAHFATWPQALVRRMILAGTSERGCCPECGVPWVRETASELAPTGRTPPPNGGELRGMTRAGNRTADGWVPNRDKTVTTLGWSPSCHHDHQPVPCTVLDPFAGSGTTSLVARNHGRHSIGIELNAAYLRIAGKRLQQLTLLA